MPTVSRRISAVWVFAILIAGVTGVSADERTPRTITLAPHLTELAFAAGGGQAMVGVVDWSDYPDRASELQSIGDAFRFDLETIIDLDPDLALAWRGGTPEAAAQRLEELGIEVLWIEIRRLEDIALALEAIGNRMNAKHAGNEAAEAFRRELHDLAGKHDRDKPVSIFYQVSARPLFTLGSRHVINQVFERCGATNIFSDLDTEAASVDGEAVIARQPDLIIAGSDDHSEQPLVRWQNSALVQEHGTSLHRVDPSVLVRPTPRIVEGIELVCDLVTGHASP